MVKPGKSSSLPPSGQQGSWRRLRLQQILILGTLNSCWFVILSIAIAGATTLSAQDPPPSAIQTPSADAAAPTKIDFNRDILPILSENCFFCHGPDAEQRQSDWRLDQRDSAVAAGVLVPQDPGSSTLLERVLSEDPDLQMPPPHSQRRLSPEQIQRLQSWIAAGAEYSSHWAFQPPVSPPIPAVNAAAASFHPIDAFLQHKMTEVQLQPAPLAPKHTLIKRLYADLVGLPPTPEQVAAFLADESPQAYERLVDALLASPHFGERLALPWLDAARYSDSNGFQQDGDTWQWLWRDWVVSAYNRDLPFDQFSIWQLAGDLLPEATTEQKIASAFNRNHLLNGEGGAIAEEQRFVGLFDRVDTTATNWLGLTMACAQCHDHKYDPLTQRDYYSLMDAFNRVNETGAPRFFSSRIRVDTPYLEVPTAENLQKIAQWEEQIQSFEAAAAPLLETAFAGWRIGILAPEGKVPPRLLPSELATLAERPLAQHDQATQDQLQKILRDAFERDVKPQLGDAIPPLKSVQQIRQQLNDYRNDQIPRVMIMSDAQPRTTHVLNRGAYLSPTEPVSFATPACLPPLPEELPRNRLGFARWLFLPDHPLTSRVQINRLWQHFFGQGLVRTAEDFGVQSEYPVQRELLDWLACEFPRRGWSVKQMVKLIVTSHAYQQSSQIKPEHLEKDPLNLYYSRGPRLRMSALILRDWALAAGGLLNPKIGGAPVYPYQPDAVWESLAITKERDFTYPQSRGDDLYRRSLYTFWRRTVAPANMFDASNRQACRVRTTVTSTPLHALTLLNDPTWIEAARVLAHAAHRQRPEDVSAQLSWAFSRVVCRPPAPAELEILVQAFHKQLGHFQNAPDAAEKLLTVGQTAGDDETDRIHWAALTHVCLGIFNLDEAQTRE